MNLSADPGHIQTGMRKIRRYGKISAMRTEACGSQLPAALSAHCAQDTVMDVFAIVFIYKFSKVESCEETLASSQGGL
jgi:hypothetical protein